MMFVDYDQAKWKVATLVLATLCGALLCTTVAMAMRGPADPVPPEPVLDDAFQPVPQRAPVIERRDPIQVPAERVDPASAHLILNNVRVIKAEDGTLYLNDVEITTEGVQEPPEPSPVPQQSDPPDPFTGPANIGPQVEAQEPESRSVTAAGWAEPAVEAVVHASHEVIDDIFVAPTDDDGSVADGYEVIPDIYVPEVRGAACPGGNCVQPLSADGHFVDGVDHPEHTHIVWLKFDERHIGMGSDVDKMIEWNRAFEEHALPKLTAAGWKIGVHLIPVDPVAFGDTSGTTNFVMFRRDNQRVPQLMAWSLGAFRKWYEANSGE